IPARNLTGTDWPFPICRPPFPTTFLSLRIRMRSVSLPDGPFVWFCGRRGRKRVSGFVDVVAGLFFKEFEELSPLFFILDAFDVLLEITVGQGVLAEVHCKTCPDDHGTGHLLILRSEEHTSELQSREK